MIKKRREVECLSACFKRLNCPCFRLSICGLIACKPSRCRFIYCSFENYYCWGPLKHPSRGIQSYFRRCLSYFQSADWSPLPEFPSNLGSFESLSLESSSGSLFCGRVQDLGFLSSPGPVNVTFDDAWPSEQAMSWMHLLSQVSWPALGSPPFLVHL
jgi:hypothetical protein